MMGWGDRLDGADGWMAVCAVLVSVALLACVIALAWMIARGRPKPESEAERELRLRLARGEIDVDEFLRQQAALRH